VKFLDGVTEMKQAFVLAALCGGLIVVGVPMTPAKAAATITGAATSQVQTADKKVKPISGLEWLIGGVWTADASTMGDGMKRIETRYVWSDNNAFIRFTTHFISDKGTAKTYDGNFFFDPEKSGLAMWYMDYANAIIQGPISIDGETTRFAFRTTDFHGKLADMQVNVVRKTNDKYQWVLDEKVGDAWKEMAALEYVRVQ
jgi:hypothetical protein